MILINKSASAAAFKAVVQLLDAALSIHVYDHVPKDAVPPYVEVEAISETAFSSKTKYGSSVQIDVTNYAEGLESKTVQETTSEIIEALKENDLAPEGFSVIGIELIRNECAEASVENVYYSTVSFNVWTEETDAGADQEGPEESETPGTLEEEGGNAGGAE